MDIIYTNALGIDQGIIQNCTLDYEAGNKNENCTFEIKTALENVKIKKGCYVYVDGEEYGGRVDTFSVDTAKGEITASGRSWRGILGSKIIEPPAGSDYYVVTGDLHDVLDQLITDAGLNELYVVGDADATVTNYKFYRYTDLYSGIIKLLDSIGLKLKMYYKAGKLYLSAVPIKDFSNEQELTSDMFDFVITTTTSVNHVIGLGRGELSERQVIHKYLDANGNVSDVQFYTGLDEYAVTYENTDCEPEELEEKTEDKLKDLAASDKLDINAMNLNADIGDKFVAQEMYTGLQVTQYVNSKIVTVSNQLIKVQYKVGKRL